MKESDPLWEVCLARIEEMQKIPPKYRHLFTRTGKIVS